MECIPAASATRGVISRSLNLLLLWVLQELQAHLTWTRVSHLVTFGEQKKEGGTQHIFKPVQLVVLLLGYPFTFGKEP